MVSGSGLAAVKVKAGSTARRVVPVAVNPVRVADLTQPNGQQWLNAKVSKESFNPQKDFMKEGELEGFKLIAPAK